MNKSAIARVERIGWNTVDRWLEKASDCGRRFNDEEIMGFRATELQADEIRTIIQGKQQPTWIFAAVEVWSRLWSSTVVGRRSYHNTLALFRDIAERANHEDILITTDGFDFYERVIGQVFGARLCLWPGDQDASEQSHREGGTSDGDWDRRAIGGKTTAV